jgi:hypothetical protein
VSRKKHRRDEWRGPRGRTPKPVPQSPPADPAAVSSWARRFRRVAAVVAVGERAPDPRAIEAVRAARRGGVGVARESVAALAPEAARAFEDRPWVVLDSPDAGLARLARLESPRVPRGLVAATVQALAHGAPVVIVGAEAARAAGPLVTYALPIGREAVARDLATSLRSSAAAVQDSMKLVARSGRAFVDLARGVVRDRTITGLLERLVQHRRRWAEKDAADRFKRLGDGGGPPSPGEFAIAYLDLLPLLIVRLGPTADLARVFERPLAHLALGLVPAIVVG